MKARRKAVEQINARLNRQAQQEISNFLLALDSYPSRVSQEPAISFEQHRDSVTKNVVPIHARRSQRPLTTGSPAE